MRAARKQHFCLRLEFPVDTHGQQPGGKRHSPHRYRQKNWLHTGSELAGIRAAVIQTLLGTAKLNDLDPFAWLKDTLEKLPTWPNSRLDELLPLRRYTPPV